MLCEMCKSQLNLEAKYCTNCGYPVGASSEYLRQNQVQSEGSLNYSNEQNQKYSAYSKDNFSQDDFQYEEAGYDDEYPEEYSKISRHNISLGRLGDLGVKVKKMHYFNKRATAIVLPIVIAIIAISLFKHFSPRLKEIGLNSIVSSSDYDLLYEQHREAIEMRIENLEASINAGNFEAIEANYDEESKYYGGLDQFIEQFDSDLSVEKLEELISGILPDEYKEKFEEAMDELYAESSTDEEISDTSKKSDTDINSDESNIESDIDTYKQKLNDFELDLYNIHDLNGLIKIELIISDMEINDNEFATVKLNMKVRYKDESLEIEPVRKQSKLRLIIADDDRWYINSPSGEIME